MSAIIEGVAYWKENEGSVSNFITNQNQEEYVKESQKQSKFEPRLKTATSRTTNSVKPKTNRGLQAEIDLSKTLLRTKN